jgi:hypothetical protein
VDLEEEKQKKVIFYVTPGMSTVRQYLKSLKKKKKDSIMTLASFYKS